MGSNCCSQLPYPYSAWGIHWGSWHIPNRSQKCIPYWYWEVSVMWYFMKRLYTYFCVWSPKQYKCFISNSVTLHPSYNAAAVSYDFAVFKLQSKVDYNSLPNVYPACWPTVEPSDGTTVRNFLPQLNPNINKLSLTGNSFWLWDNIRGWINF